MEKNEQRAFSAGYGVTCISLVLLLMLGSTLAAQEQSDTTGETSQLERWEETLRFGIDTEVETLIEQVERAGVRTLDDSLTERFKRSRSTSLQKAIIEYFTRRNSADIVIAVQELLLSEDVTDQELIRVSSSYLSSQDAAQSEALLDRYEEIAQDSNLLTASVAVEAIGRSGHETAVARLLSLYEELTSVDERSAVLRGLGHTEDPEALELLSRVAGDEFEESALRHYATESIGRIGSPESVELLTELLSDGDSVLRAYATRALGFYPGDTSMPRMNEALLDSFWRVRVAALQGIAEQKDPGSVAAVAYKAERDPEAPVREQAVKTLGAIGTEEAAQALAEILLNTRSAETLRMSAAGELMSIDAGGNLETLREIINAEWDREGSRLLDTIGKTLSTSGDPQLEPIFLRFLEHSNFIIRIYGMRGIASAGLMEHVERLKEAARVNKQGIMRTTAMNALNELGVEFDPDAEPAVEASEEVEGESAEDSNPSADSATD